MLNADKELIKIYISGISSDGGKRGKKDIHKYIAFFFSKYADSTYTYDLLQNNPVDKSCFINNVKNYSENILLSTENVYNIRFNKDIRKDIDYINSLSDIYEYGCIGYIRQQLEEDTVVDDIKKVGSVIDKDKPSNIQRITVDILGRVKIKKLLNNNKCELTILNDEKYNINDKKIKLYHIELINKIKEIIKLNSPNAHEYNLLLNFYNLKNIYTLINFIGNISINKNSLLQDMFESNNLVEKLKKCLCLLNNDIYFLKIKKKLNHNLTTKFMKEKKDLLIKEYIINLKKELGEKTQHEELCEEFIQKLNSIKHVISSPVHTLLYEEINRFRICNENNNNNDSYNSSYQYLNTVFNIPFNTFATIPTNIDTCEKILNSNHYGLCDVKIYLLEYLNLYILNKNVKPKVLLFVGYPGVGKTSICTSISKCLNLPICFINMNNVHNKNDIIGHRKTYVNSYEGKIINALTTTKVMNPLIVLDEFDKLFYINKDIFNTFLNMFDYNQNKFFKDQYINFEVDISNIFFICTANSIDNIPHTLLNRMEIIYFFPYTNKEKLLIFKNHLKNKIEKDTKITDNHLFMSDELLLYIIQNYTDENGVRQLYNIIYNIYKKRAYMLIKGLDKQIKLTIENKNDLIHFVSMQNAQCRKGKQFHILGSFSFGVVKSLAFTDDGGHVIMIEVTNAGSDIRKDTGSGTGSGIDRGNDKGARTGSGIDTDTYSTTCCIKNSSGSSSSSSQSSQSSQNIQNSYNIIVTGNVGQLMQESILIANTYSIKLLNMLYPGFECKHLHFNLNESDFKKDGPSAGINFVTSILSYYLKIPVDPSLCMTGEITLNGYISKIGGLVEKFIVAKNYGIRTLIIPKDNAQEYELMSNDIKQNIHVMYVYHYYQIFNLLFNKDGKRRILL
uniref:Lon protease homolog n=1 Tax=Piliocolobus tephrosceles TaxID=591936 RepID=A0A8C9GL94_9PRIM